MNAKCRSPLLLLSGAGKRYGSTWALRNVSLTIEKPGLYVLYGPNGSGKSTLIKLILGLTRPSTGKVMVCGFDPSWRPGRVLRLVSHAIEGAAVPPYMEGRELARAIAEARHVSLQHIEEAAQGLGVTEYWSRYIYTYSMGMRKKLLLAIALGLAREAAMLVLDEPYTLLDERSKRTASTMISQLSKRMPVIVATHIFSRAEETAETVYVLEGGAIKNVISRSTSLAYRCPLTRRLLSLIENKEAIKASIDWAREEAILEGPQRPPLEECTRIILPPSTS